MYLNSKNKQCIVIKEEILLDFKLCREAFKWVIGNFSKRKKKIKWIILAEAPLSYSDYFYNPVNEKYSAFLSSSNIQIASKTKIKTKYEAIMKLIDHGILIIDLYPLPLPSDCYGNKGYTFYCKELVYDYWNELFADIEAIVEKSTRITRRYKKHSNNADATKFVEIFNEKFGTDNSLEACIGSPNMPIDQSEFNKLFV